MVVTRSRQFGNGHGSFLKPAHTYRLRTGNKGCRDQFW